MVFILSMNTHPDLISTQKNILYAALLSFGELAFFELERPYISSPAKNWIFSITQAPGFAVSLIRYHLKNFADLSMLDENNFVSVPSSVFADAATLFGLSHSSIDDRMLKFVKLPDLIKILTPEVLFYWYLFTGKNLGHENDIISLSLYGYKREIFTVLQNVMEQKYQISIILVDYTTSTLDPGCTEMTVAIYNHDAKRFLHLLLSETENVTL